MIGKGKYRDTFRTDVVTIGDSEYHIRELSIQERVAWQDYCSENDHNELLGCAWLVATACLEFQQTWWQRLLGRNPDLVKLTENVGITWLAEVAREILELSDMVPDPESVEQAVNAEPEEDEPTVPGTVDDAKKNFEADRT